MSILVISLVVWLLLLFLSVTEGIEKNWLGRLTALNAPIRVVPTDLYYHSYYYKIDTIAQKSNYALKNIHEKLNADLSDPYDGELDEAIPSYWPSPIKDPEGNLLDPVKRLFTSFESLEQTNPSFIARDYEISGVMFRLHLLRSSFMGEEEQSFLSQVSYVSTFPKDAKSVQKLFTPPTVSDVNHLLYRYPEEFHRILAHVNLEEITPLHYWTLPLHLIPEKAKLRGTLSHGSIVLKKEGETLFTKQELKETRLPIRVEGKLPFKATIEENSLFTAQDLQKVSLLISGEVQGVRLEGRIPWKDLQISKAKIAFVFTAPPLLDPLWVYTVDDKTFLPDPQGVIIPKNFRDNGVNIGDVGQFSYGSFAATSVQEQSIPIKVMGFYDPGLIMVGARPIFAEDFIVETINSASSSVPLDPLLCNGIQIWFDDLSKTREIASHLQRELEKEGIAPYWQIKTFHDYDFAKDLLSQFRSDRYLFTLIGLIILIVACTNIISLLLLLVHGKKKEIAILQVLGAKKWHIALIFGLGGAFIGILSSALGSLLGLITLQNIDALVRFLSFLQGQQAFNTAFYGSSLPSSVSQSSLLFILVTTPILSLLAGLIPAVKACQFPPAETLRSE